MSPFFDPETLKLYMSPFFNPEAPDLNVAASCDNFMLLFIKGIDHEEDALQQTA
jgi:hypothetical protein